MSTAKNIANRWYSQMAGTALIVFALIGLSVPAPTIALHSLEDKAIQQLMPLISQSSIGKQMLEMYVAHDKQCHRSL